MPLSPILNRTGLFARNRKDNTIRQLDINLVNTTVGAAVEPRSVTRMPGDFTSAANDSASDTSINDLMEVGLDEEDGTLSMTTGLQTPSSW